MVPFKGIDSDLVGDAYTFLGIERDSKIILAHQVGRRTSEHANIFAAKLATATRPANGETFQMSTDGFDGYPAAIEEHFGATANYGQIIKSFVSGGMDSNRRYSPPSIIAILWGVGGRFREQEANSSAGETPAVPGRAHPRRKKLAGGRRSRR